VPHNGHVFYLQGLIVPILGSLSTVIGKCSGNITNLRITSRSTEFFEIIVDIEVKDLNHLTEIMAALRATPVINSVERITHS
jgi:GTP pyrophosphokinase